MNKVIGNIHLSPGRSFQTGGRNFYELVPYLREEGRRHDFSHTINEFAFEGDDEYDPFKSAASTKMRQKMGIEANPLDGTTANVRMRTNCDVMFALTILALDNQITLHVPVLPQGRVYSFLDPGWALGECHELSILPE